MSVLQVSSEAFLDEHVKIPGLGNTQIIILVQHVVTQIEKSDIFAREGQNMTPRKFGTVVSHVCALCDTFKQSNPEYTEALSTRTTVFTSKSRMPATSVNAMLTSVHFASAKSTIPGCVATGVAIADVVVPLVFERGATQTVVVDKIRAACAHILHYDPARRFVYALSAEKSGLRLWFCSRAYVGVTEAFDFHAKPEIFIRFLLFVIYGSLESLGYDTNVARVLVNERVEHRITVKGRTYQIIDVIDKPVAPDIVSRATRVWKVRLVSADGELVGGYMVLKDVWLNEGAPRELQIQDEIFNKLRILDNEVDTGGKHAELKSALDAARLNPVGHPLLPSSGTLHDDAKSYFMTIVADVVVTLSDGSEDIACLPEASVLTAPSQSKARVHVRMIFKECCETIGSLMDYREFSSALADVVKGLNYMRLAGYVHCDISPGNCLLHRATKQVKISDLEYAREYAGSSGHIPTLGTPGFMAVESQAEEHLFLPRLPVHYLIDVTLDDVALASPAPWFEYNYIHDLESVAWLYLWRLLTSIPESLPRENSAVKTTCANIQVIYSQYFDGNLRGSRKRDQLLKNPSRAGGVLEIIKNLMAYGQVQQPRAELNGLNVFLVLSAIYSEIEASEPLQPTESKRTHWNPLEFKSKHYVQVHDIFAAVAAKLEGVGCVGMAGPNWKGSSESKRTTMVKNSVTQEWNTGDHDEGEEEENMDHDDEVPVALDAAGKGKGGSGRKRTLPEIQADNPRPKRSKTTGDDARKPPAHF